MKRFILIAFVLIMSANLSLGQDRQKTFQKCYDNVNRLIFDEMVDRSVADETIVVCNKAIELEPKLANLYEGRGLGYLYFAILGGDFPVSWQKLALEDFNKSLELQPRNSRALGFRGETYFLLKNLDLALSDLNLAIEINPTNLYALYRRALVFQAKDDKASAVIDLQEILKHDSSDAKATKLLAELQQTPKKKSAKPSPKRKKP